MLENAYNMCLAEIRSETRLENIYEFMTLFMEDHESSCNRWAPRMQKDGRPDMAMFCVHFFIRCFNISFEGQITRISMIQKNISRRESELFICIAQTFYEMKLSKRQIMGLIFEAVNVDSAVFVEEYINSPHETKIDRKDRIELQEREDEKMAEQLQREYDAEILEEMRIQELQSERLAQEIRRKQIEEEDRERTRQYWASPEGIVKLAEFSERKAREEAWVLEQAEIAQNLANEQAKFEADEAERVALNAEVERKKQEQNEANSRFDKPLAKKDDVPAKPSGKKSRKRVKPQYW
jgi:hypothetical protein